MSRLLDPALRASMALRARGAVAPLTREAMASQLLALYRASLERIGGAW
jgi:hypothetical protein